MCFKRELLIDLLGCMNDCHLPEKYVCTIFAFYILQIIASLIACWGIMQGISALAFTFIIFWLVMVIFGVVFWFLVKDYSLLV
jgi:hypothetical protein